MDVNGIELPLAVRHVSGGGHPEIIVASGGSPSLGGWLQAFDVSGGSFRKVAYINGRYFRVTATTAGRPAVIAARWMEEDQGKIYNWNGREFEATEKH